MIQIKGALLMDEYVHKHRVNVGGQQNHTYISQDINSKPKNGSQHTQEDQRQEQSQCRHERQNIICHPHVSLCPFLSPSSPQQLHTNSHYEGFTFGHSIYLRKLLLLFQKLQEIFTAHETIRHFYFGSNIHMSSNIHDMSAELLHFQYTRTSLTI